MSLPVDSAGEPPDELLPLVDEEGRVIGRATRAAVHQDRALLHPTVQIYVTNARGALLLQRRGQRKSIDPGLWDVSVGGHVRFGESIEEAAIRELFEEIGWTGEPSRLHFLHATVYRDAVESELIYDFHLVSEGPFLCETEEISALRFWTRMELDAALGHGLLTESFEAGFARFCEAVGWQQSVKELPMGYRIDMTAPMAEELRRIVAEQLSSAVERLLSAQGDGWQDAVHELRKTTKRVRALLRMVGRGLPRRARKSWLRSLRQAAVCLAQNRDQAVLVCTLEKAYRGVFPEAESSQQPWARLLPPQSGAGDTPCPLPTVVHGVAETLRKLQSEVTGSDLPLLDFPTTVRGLVRSYRRGRRRFARYQKKPSAKALHELRKRVKDQLYQLRLVVEVSPSTLRDQAVEFDCLAELLGDHHDLVNALQALVEVPRDAEASAEKSCAEPPGAEPSCVEPVGAEQACVEPTGAEHASAAPLCGEPASGEATDAERDCAEEACGESSAQAGVVTASTQEAPEQEPGERERDEAERMALREWLRSQLTKLEQEAVVVARCVYAESPKSRARRLLALHAALMMPRSGQPTSVPPGATE